MILRNKIEIKRPSAEVWRYIAETSMMKSWNQKVKVVVPVSQGPMCEGFRYRVKLEMNGRESNFLAEILEYNEPRRLVIYFTGGNMHVRGYVQEIYELFDTANGTLMKQTVDMHGTGVNIFMRSLAVFLHVLGISDRRKSLKRLRDVVEGGIIKRPADVS